MSSQRFVSKRVKTHLPSYHKKYLIGCKNNIHGAYNAYPNITGALKTKVGYKSFYANHHFTNIL